MEGVQHTEGHNQVQHVSVGDPSEHRRRDERTAQGPLGPKAWRWEGRGGEEVFEKGWQELRVREGAEVWVNKLVMDSAIYSYAHLAPPACAPRPLP